MHGILVGGMIVSEYLGIGVSVRYPIKARLGRIFPKLRGSDRSDEGRGGWITGVRDAHPMSLTELLPETRFCFSVGKAVFLMPKGLILY